MRRKKEPHFVYLLKDGDIVVYVGCTKDLKMRMYKHKDKPHNNVEVIKFNYKNDALIMERKLACEHLPKYNHIYSQMLAYRLYISKSIRDK